MLTAVSGFTGICVLTFLSVRFSSDYIPSAWSDFSFFKQLFKEKTEDILTLIRKPLFYADSVMLGALAGVFVLSIVITCILLRHIRKYIMPYNAVEDLSDDIPQSLQSMPLPADKQGFLQCISSSSAHGVWWRWRRYRERTAGRRP